MADLLKDTEIQERASQLSSWTVEGKQLRCTRLFKDFTEAIAFVNKLVAASEAAAHHPKNEREAPGFRHGEERGCDLLESPKKYGTA